MLSTNSIPALMTPEQVAEYLQISRDLVYRYIREGRLQASRLGRLYRIPRESVEDLLWLTRARPDIALREYSDEEVASFLEADQLEGKTAEIAERWQSKLADQ